MAKHPSSQAFLRFIIFEKAFIGLLSISLSIRALSLITKIWAPVGASSYRPPEPRSEVRIRWRWKNSASSHQDDRRHFDQGHTRCSNLVEAYGCTDASACGGG
jgi:hypothetical protein